MKFIFLVVLMRGFVSAAEPAADPCREPLFEWLGRQSVQAITPVFETCAGNGKIEIAIRRFTKAKHPYLLLVNPDTLETSIEGASCLRCIPSSPEYQPSGVAPTRLTQALHSVALLNARGGKLTNAGLTHAEKPVRGVFLTIDFCPSKKRGLDEVIFRSLRELKGSIPRPIPVALSVAATWFRAHQDSIEWLLEQQRAHEISITWVNHSLTHPYDANLPLAHNFLLEKGVSMEREVLGVEQILLEYGLVPSIFFRFPGLVADVSHLEQLRQYTLIPIGTDAWLAKNQTPTPGSIILIHGNRNEPLGVADFLTWLSKEQNDIRFLPLTQLF